MALPSIRCMNPADLFKPQWAYQTPEGFRDEVYLVPFTFSVAGDGSLVKGLPLQLDDDVPFILRGIFFPQIGFGNALPLTSPGFCRITDTQGNPLSDGLVLALGAWCLSGWDDSALTGEGTAAFGFPIESDVVNSPGGALVFDFQLTTNAGVASVTLAGVAESIKFSANVFGLGGNGFTVALQDPGGPNVALSIAYAVGAIQVTLATDAGAVITSTFQDVADIVNNPLVSVIATLSGSNPSEVITATAPGSPLVMSGGAVSSPITVNGSLLGVKRFKDC